MVERPKPFSGIRHVAFEVDDLEACERFYVEVMGMEVLWRASPDLVYLTCGNDNLSLARAKAPRSGRGPFDHFGFIVDSKADLDRWHAYMKAKGVEVLDQPHDHRDGARSFHLKDPAGNVIQPIFHPAVSGQRFSPPA
jgi:catechol 2,3-dioxygenase-like lactoylglutathione lyase family enzyme